MQLLYISDWGGHVEGSTPEIQLEISSPFKISVLSQCAIPCISLLMVQVIVDRYSNLSLMILFFAIIASDLSSPSKLNNFHLDLLPPTRMIRWIV
jgi:hypothetical protein